MRTVEWTGSRRGTRGRDVCMRKDRPTFHPVVRRWNADRRQTNRSHRFPTFPRCFLFRAKLNLIESLVRWNCTSVVWGRARERKEERNTSSHSTNASPAEASRYTILLTGTKFSRPLFMYLCSRAPKRKCPGAHNKWLRLRHFSLLNSTYLTYPDNWRRLRSTFE